MIPESTCQENTNQRALFPSSSLGFAFQGCSLTLKEQLGKKLGAVAAITTCHRGVAGKGDQICACQSDKSRGRWHGLQSKTCHSQKGEQSIKSTVMWSQKMFFSTYKEERDFAMLIFKVEDKGIFLESLDISRSVSN